MLFGRMYPGTAAGLGAIRGLTFCGWGTIGQSGMTRGKILLYVPRLHRTGVGNLS